MKESLAFISLVKARACRDFSLFWLMGKKAKNNKKIKKKKIFFNFLQVFELLDGGELGNRNELSNVDTPGRS